MKPSFICLLVLILSASACADDWPWWRGPNSNGVAADGQTPPTKWDTETNIVWKTPIPGRGHSSPTVVGQQIFLTSADKASGAQAVFAFDRKTGRQLWARKVNEGGLPKEIHTKNTHASPTIAYDGERLFAVFNNHGGVQLVALKLDGTPLWQKKAASFVPKKYKFGFAPSPLIYKDTVIVASEYDGEGSSIAAFKRSDGEEVWRTARAEQTSYSSPIVANVAGRDQLLISGANKVTSYNPADGKQLWSVAGPAHATCGTLVWNDDLVFASGGYPQKETLAVKADGSGEVVWRNKEKSYEQSMLYHDGHLYAHTDAGIAFCWRASDGVEMWKQRLAGPVSVSPILAGGNIYAASEKGTTFVFRATPDKFDLVSKNQLGHESFATPAFVDNQIITRVASHDGERQEYLVCIGE